ncbi:hypothetical protein [Paenibacillus sp. HB172176]|uniref:hypothetical protein n=1 Tax=Paenibacillus sp. HB172176 TaxID=2493690 RepID=UPI00143A55BA|nr:hypothetical protein [Paenibacillus sp. HB172176]
MLRYRSVKRYGLILLLFVLAVSGIGYYYAIGRTDYMPEYKLELVQGSTSEGEAIIIPGDYYLSGHSEHLTITEEGTEFSALTRNQRTSITNREEFMYSYLGMEDLLEKHRSFLRGKKRGIGGFYRDEKQTVYSEVQVKGSESSAPKAKFATSILDEETGKSRELHTSLDVPKGTVEMNVYDVQLLESKIFILVYVRNKPSQEYSYHVYAFDEKNGDFVEDTKLNLWENRHRDDTLPRQLSTDIITMPSERIYFQVSGRSVGRKEEEYVYYSYSYLTGELKELQNETWQEAYVNPNDSISRFDFRFVNNLQTDYLYHAKQTSTQLQVSRMDLATNDVDDDYLSISAKKLGSDEINDVKISGERIYLLTHTDGIPGAFVLDLMNGNILYQGKVVKTGGSRQSNEEASEQLHVIDLSLYSTF